ncbi:MAG: penicillin-binding protein [Bryobacteraceae bacterium]
MDSPAKRQIITRASWLAYAAVAWGLAIGCRLVYLQVFRHDDYAIQARDQHFKMVEIPAPRGSIFDRNGQALAISVPIHSIFVNPKRLRSLETAADVIAPALNLDRNALYKRLKSARGDPKRDGFLWVKRKITRAEAENIRSLIPQMPWIEIETESQRHYPRGRVASHVVGTVDHQGNGNSGLELGEDEDLRGEVGSAEMLTDVNKRGIESELFEPPKVGTSLTISIDERLQFVVERELAEAVTGNSCTTGSIVVMNPHNGEILAMASYPSFDPNLPPEKGDKSFSRLNMAIAAPFEPGSVFKVFTLAAALETTNLRPDSVMPCGRLNIGSRSIREAKHYWGPLSFQDVLAKSSNVGAVQIGMRVGKDKLYQYIHGLGFGQKTGLPLPSEAGGTVRRPERWLKDSIGSVPMGHEISTTTVQLAQACSVIANGGLLIRPKLILKRQFPDGKAEKEPSDAPVRVVRPETAITMRQLMERVMFPGGTGQAARVEGGYSSGGKTGSAQIYDFEKKHYTSFYNASFMGFAPVTNPSVVVVVTLNHSRVYGGVVAAPVFKRVTQEALRVLEVPKDVPLPDAPLIAESAPPAPAMFGPPLPPVEMEPVNDSGDVYGPRVPDFQGMTAREVVRTALSKGLPITLNGRGVARLQRPRAGTILPRGEKVRVDLAR